MNTGSTPEGRPMQEGVRKNRTFLCFGLVIHGHDLDHVMVDVMTRASQGLQTWIVTANPEILLYAKRNPEYWEILRQADLRLVDGKGLQFAGWYRGAHPRRLTGVELADALAKLCHEKHWTIGLIGGNQPEAADQAAWYLRRKYPDISVFAEQGGKVSPTGILDEQGESALNRLAETDPDVVLVALGHPKQDYWIQRYRDRFPKAKVFIGVGGTIYFWSGQAQRAPGWMRTIGFEWLWRLMHEPWRFRRIWDAVVVFPLAVLFDER